MQLSNDFWQWNKEYPVSAYLVALSGGRDSVALLRLLIENKEKLAAPLSACYINHGWHEDANLWGDFCRNLCQKYQIPLQIISLNLDVKSNAEALAREARYKSLAEILPQNGVLLTGHQLDDQVETFFIQLLRGAGLGLSAMPMRKSFAKGEHWRPMLNIRRAEISAYLQELKQDFLDDPSNENCRFQRNLIRLQLLPRWEELFPHFYQAVAQSCANLASAKELQNQLISSEVISTDYFPWAEILKIHGLNYALSLLRIWLQEKTQTIPPKSRLDSFIKALNSAKKQALLKYQNVILRHYQGNLFLENDQFIAEAPGEVQAINQWQGIGTLQVKCDDFSDLNWEIYPSKALFHEVGKKYPHNLKNYFQNNKISPQERRKMPLLVRNGRVIWLAGKYSVNCGNIKVTWQK